jgi:hypothetical protein
MLLHLKYGFEMLFIVSESSGNTRMFAFKFRVKVQMYILKEVSIYV